MTACQSPIGFPLLESTGRRPESPQKKIYALSWPRRVPLALVPTGPFYSLVTVVKGNVCTLLYTVRPDAVVRGEEDD